MNIITNITFFGSKKSLNFDFQLVESREFMNFVEMLFSMETGIFTHNIATTMIPSIPSIAKIACQPRIDVFFMKLTKAERSGPATTISAGDTATKIATVVANLLLGNREIDSNNDPGKIAPPIPSIERIMSKTSVEEAPICANTSRV